MALEARCQFGPFCCRRVGAGLARARDELGIGRDALFVQSKFTPLPGQGRDVRHDRRAAPSEQVEQSLARSLSNLGTDSLDSYLLHAPQGWRGLTDADWAVWEPLVAAYRHGRARRIGISNAELPHLEELLVFLIDEFTAATPHWHAFNRARAIHRPMEQGFRKFHADRAAERAAGVLFDPPPPWQHQRWNMRALRFIHQDKGMPRSLPQEPYPPRTYDVLRDVAVCTSSQCQPPARR